MVGTAALSGVCGRHSSKTSSLTLKRSSIRSTISWLSVSSGSSSSTKVQILKQKYQKASKEIFLTHFPFAPSHWTNSFGVGIYFLGTKISSKKPIVRRNPSREQLLTFPTRTSRMKGRNTMNRNLIYVLLKLKFIF